MKVNKKVLIFIKILIPGAVIFFDQSYQVLKGRVL